MPSVSQHTPTRSGLHSAPADFGARIRALRLALGLSQEALATRTGLSRISVVAAEQGKNQMTGTALRSGLARAFCLSDDDFGAYLDGRLTVEMAAARRVPDATPEAEQVGLRNLGDRIWYAWHCLPRARGRTPRKEHFERDHGLPRGLLGDLFSGARQYVSDDVLRKLAEALRVTPEWLRTGEGALPTLTGMVKSREVKYPMLDVATVEAALSVEAEAAAGSPLSNFARAALRIGDRISRRAVAIARERARTDAPVEDCIAALIAGQQQAFRELVEEYRADVTSSADRRPTARPRRRVGASR